MDPISKTASMSRKSIGSSQEYVLAILKAAWISRAACRLSAPGADPRPGFGESLCVVTKVV